MEVNYINRIIELVNENEKLEYELKKTKKNIDNLYNILINELEKKEIKINKSTKYKILNDFKIYIEKIKKDGKI